jgi:hypothetical protein
MKYTGITKVEVIGTLPISVENVKKELRIFDDDSQDIFIDSKITAAVPAIEKYLNRTLVYSEFILFLSYFPESFEIPNPPCKEIVEIKYYDFNYELHTLDLKFGYQKFHSF